MKFVGTHRPSQEIGDVGHPWSLARTDLALRSLVLFPILLFISLPSAAETAVQAALSSALQATPAVGMIVEVKTGRQLAAVGTAQPSPPGSILKPLFLAAALEHQQMLPQTTVFCRRSLQITDGNRSWNLPCTHPQSDVAFAAQEALAYSCNTYFAALADRISAPQATAILQHYGLGQAQTAQSREQKQFLVLGISGIAVSPAQIAAAYRKLALDLESPALRAVREGLGDSVRYGMAHNAAVPGTEIAGKTGTTGDGGWFAGMATLNHEEVVLVIYLPRGNGADAARLAQHFFLASAPDSARSLTVELWSARPVTHLTATPFAEPKVPREVEWMQDGLRTSTGKIAKQLALHGRFRMRAFGAQDVVAAGSWTVAWQPGGLRVLLTLPSEDYVVAALSGEAAPDEPIASLKAMAISMRTFALVNAGRHHADGFGLCDSTHCQALRLGKPRREVEQAVRETAGETLWSGGQRAHVYYTQHCGGLSEAAADVWPAERAIYLPGKHADPYCLRRSAAEWTAHMGLPQLSEILHAQGWHTPSPIESVRVIRQSATGRAELLQVTGKGAPAQLSASSFRFAVDRALGWNQMRSDWYTATVTGATLILNGKGYGHGVGLCQAGSYEMAAEGHSAAEILNFYFPGAIAGITPADRGWQTIVGAGWTLLTTDPRSGLLAEGNAAWARAQSLLGEPAAPNHPLVQELPTTELFRQTTGEPGWMLASTRDGTVFLQPATVRRNNGATQSLLVHEFLHVLVEQQAGEKAPLWLREGLVEFLAGPTGENLDSVDLPPGDVDAALAHPTSAAVSRHAHQLAQRMAALLCAHYGMPTVREFLRNGVPSEAIKSPGLKGAV